MCPSVLLAIKATRRAQCQQVPRQAGSRRRRPPAGGLQLCHRHKKKEKRPTVTVLPLGARSAARSATLLGAQRRAALVPCNWSPISTEIALPSSITKVLLVRTSDHNQNHHECKAPAWIKLAIFDYQNLPTSVRVDHHECTHSRGRSVSHALSLANDHL